MRKIFFLLLALCGLIACTPDAITNQISGRIVFAGDETKTVKNTVIEAIGEQSYQAAVKPDGTWSIDVQPGEYTIHPFGRTDTLNGIDLDDRTLIQQHLVEIIPLGQWAKFAADINKDEIMTSHDGYIVGAAVLGVNNARWLIGGWWTYCPAGYAPQGVTGFYVPVYPTTVNVDATLGDVDSVNFVGFRRGDVNMNANPDE